MVWKLSTSHCHHYSQLIHIIWNKFKFCKQWLGFPLFTQSISENSPKLECDSSQSFNWDISSSPFRCSETPTLCNLESGDSSLYEVFVWSSWSSFFFTSVSVLCKTETPFSMFFHFPAPLWAWFNIYHASLTLLPAEILSKLTSSTH